MIMSKRASNLFTPYRLESKPDRENGNEKKDPSLRSKETLRRTRPAESLGAGCVGDQEKEWTGCFLDDLRASGIVNADQWTTAAQDEGEWRRTAEQGAEHFMAKWIVAEKTKAGLLRHAVVCPKVTGRTEKRISQSKRARAASLALV